MPLLAMELHYGDSRGFWGQNGDGCTVEWNSFKTPASFVEVQSMVRAGIFGEQIRCALEMLP